MRFVKALVWNPRKFFLSKLHLDTIVPIWYKGYMKPKIGIELRKASDLIKTTTTASGIRNDFLKGTFPLFYHSYRPDAAFVAVPPDWLEELTKKAGEFELSEELNRKINETHQVKDKIIQQLRQKAKKRLTRKA